MITGWIIRRDSDPAPSVGLAVPSWIRFQMMDFGMRDWMRYCEGGFLVVLIVALGLPLVMDFQPSLAWRGAGERTPSFRDEA